MEGSRVLVLDPLPVVAIGVRSTVRVQGGRSVRSRCRGLLWTGLAAVQQAALPLPWLLCLLGARAGIGGPIGMHSFDWFWDQQLALGLGLLLLVTSGAAVLRDRLLRFQGVGGGADLGPLFATVALFFWHLGFQRAPGYCASASGRWCLALVKSTSVGPRTTTYQALHNGHAAAAVGLMLLDDVVRAVFKFIASAPLDAWPFALTNRATHALWVHDEEWWEACYQGTSWLRLPSKPRSAAEAGDAEDTDSLPWLPSGGPRQLLREAALWASMMAQTFGMVVMLRPKCAQPSWVLAPCLASTLLVVSCAPWLPRQSNLVLVEMLQLLRRISKFAIYFQVIWVAVAGLLLRPEDLALCTLAKDAALPLRSLEAGALAVLYIIVAGHLWAVTARCRVASPLYAVPAEDLVGGVLGRPLYCGTLGLVEGSYAPTRMCDWEDLAALPHHVHWRDRYALRRCAELLAAREAHLLSYLEALHLRISEAELEMSGCVSHCQTAGPTRAHRVTTGILALIAAASCLTVGLGFASHARAMSWAGPDDGLFEGALWALLLLRVGHGWFSIMSSSVAAWEAAGQEGYAEAAALRQRVGAVHRSLAEVQWLLGQLEMQLAGGCAAAQVQQQHPRRGLGRSGGGDGRDGWLHSPVSSSSLRALAVGWLLCLLAPAMLLSSW